MSAGDPTNKNKKSTTIPWRMLLWPSRAILLPLLLTRLVFMVCCCIPAEKRRCPFKRSASVIRILFTTLILRTRYAMKGPFGEEEGRGKREEGRGKERRKEGKKKKHTEIRYQQYIQR